MFHRVIVGESMLAQLNAAASGDIGWSIPRKLGVRAPRSPSIDLARKKFRRDLVEIVAFATQSSTPTSALTQLLWHWQGLSRQPQPQS
jgi:hypothetical protein